MASTSNPRKILVKSITWVWIVGLNVLSFRLKSITEAKATWVFLNVSIAVAAGPHANMALNSNNHLSHPQWFLVCYTYGPATVRALLYGGRWKPLAQTLITLFIYYYLCPGAKNTINLAKLDLKDFKLTCFQFKLNHGCIK